MTHDSNVSAYDFGPFRLDLQSRQLLRGEPVPLTPKVFQTLLVLLEHRDRVVSKDELMKAIWPDSFVSEDSLTQSIWALRRALGDDPAQPQFIATIPKRGYRFIAEAVAISAPAVMAAVEPPRTASEPLESPHDGVPELVSVLAHAPRTKWQFAIAGAVVAAIAMTATFYRSGTTPAPPLSLRFTVQPPDGYDLASGGVVSPNGRHIAYVARDTDSGETNLLIRDIDSPEARHVSGADGALAPFWSPDGRFVAFFAQNTLRKVDVTRAAPAEMVATISTLPAAGSWSTTGRILYADTLSGLFVVSASGEGARPVELVTASQSGYRWPQFLPDGEHFLYFVTSEDPLRSGTFIGSLDSRHRTRLFDASYMAVTFAPPDRLLFVRERSLFAQRFRLDDYRLDGEPIPLMSATSPIGLNDETFISTSNTGLLAFRSASASEHLTWFDRSGRRLAAATGGRSLRNPSLSPDNRHVLADSSMAGLWLLDLDRGSSTEVVSDGKVAMWSPDGATIAYTAGRREGIEDIYTRSIHHPADDKVLISNTANTAPATIRLDDWSRDGRYIVFVAVDPTTKLDLWVYPTSGDLTPRPFLRTAAREMQGRISPDGHWIAYSSDESGAWEIYLQSFPVPGWKRRVSLNGGLQPQWRADGGELFFVAGNHTLMTVGMTIHDREPRLGDPRTLFRLPTTEEPERIRNLYVASNDGQRFLVDTSTRDPRAQDILVITNWSAAASPTRSQ